MYTALYKVEVFDEIAGSGTFTECGILYAESFSHAMKQLEDFYGDDIQTVHFLELYDTTVFTFDPKHLETIQNIVGEVFE